MDPRYRKGTHRSIARGGFTLPYRGIEIKATVTGYGWQVTINGERVPESMTKGWTAQEIIDAGKELIDVEINPERLRKAEATCKAALAEQGRAMLAFRAAVGTPAQDEIMERIRQAAPRDLTEDAEKIDH